MADRQAEINDLDPLAVKPKVAWKMLACSNTRGYELWAASGLESDKEGRSRKITVPSKQSSRCGSPVAAMTLHTRYPAVPAVRSELLSPSQRALINCSARDGGRHAPSSSAPRRPRYEAAASRPCPWLELPQSNQTFHTLLTSWNVPTSPPVRSAGASRLTGGRASRPRCRPGR
jgi:hypothetical protein